MLAHIHMYMYTHTTCISKRLEIIFSAIGMSMPLLKAIVAHESNLDTHSTCRTTSFKCKPCVSVCDHDTASSSFFCGKDVAGTHQQTDSSCKTVYVVVFHEDNFSSYTALFPRLSPMRASNYCA